MVTTVTFCVFCADFDFSLCGEKIEMDCGARVECSYKTTINYETMNSGNTMTTQLAVTLAANPIVEKCLAKMANDVTTQVRDKLIDIIIAVLTRECEDFDGESVRRLIVAELETTPIEFVVEKHVSAEKKKTTEKKEKVVELDADGNPIKKVRTPKEPKEPKEKAPKAPKEAKPVLTAEEREAIQAERKAARKMQADAAKEAQKAEKEAEKEARKAEKEAEKETRKAEKEAEKEALKSAKPAKEQRIPIPWCGVRVADRCEALRSYHGLFAQCVANSTETSAFCVSCEKQGAPFGTVSMRSACGVFDYTDPKGKKCVKLANVVDKFGVEGGIDAFIAEAAKHGIIIPSEHLVKDVKSRGRPKSASPRAKIATSDTGSGSETETDDEEHQAKKEKQQRKKVVKAAGADAAPKKRGRPAKAKEVAPEATDDLIHQLVTNAKKAENTNSTPTVVSSPELSEEEVVEVTPVVVVKPQAKPQAKPKTKVVVRKVMQIEGEDYWIEQWNGDQILVRCENMIAYNMEGDEIGSWDDKKKTVTECDEEEE